MTDLKIVEILNFHNSDYEV